MTSEQLFEDYDPEMEDVFGRNQQMTPRRIEVSEKQKIDPLRKPKVILGSILSAEKLPITVQQIKQRMMDEDGCVMDPTKFGFRTLEDLLEACKDTVIHQRTREGVHVYAAKVNEANQDIMELVQQQTDRSEAKKAPKSFLRNSQNGPGSYGSAFRKGPSGLPTRILGEDMSNRTNRGTTQQFQARNKLGPAKTAARVRNLAEVLRSYRSELGTEHPDEPGRRIVTLAELQEKFKQIYGLPAWGKLMPENELHAALDQPEFSGILGFWRLKENGDVFVEELETPEEPTTSSDPTPAPAPPAPAPVRAPIQQAQPIRLIQNPVQEVQHVRVEPEEIPVQIPIQMGRLASRSKENTLNVTVRSARPTTASTNLPDDNSIITLDDFSICDTTGNSNMLLQEDKCDGFFESGPGFGGNSRSSAGAAPLQPSTESRQNFSEVFARFGGDHGGPTAPAPMPTVGDANVLELAAAVDPLDLSQQDSLGFDSQDNSIDQDIPDPHPSSAPPPPRIAPMRPIDGSFPTARAIIPRNPMKLIADYIKTRGAVPFSSLPDDDKVMVNFSKHVFKVFATQPGDMNVRLVDPDCDTAMLQVDEKNLRAPIEADLRWMWDQQVTKPPTTRVLVKPVMFVAPRGFLVVSNYDDPREADESKIDRMKNVLRAQMHCQPLVDLERKDIRPGMPAVYMFQEGREVQYYRVIVLGKAHQEGDIMVLLVDHDDQYCVDVQISQLFPLPEKAAFKYFAPNVLFAALHGVQGMAEEEQEILWKNADEEEHKNFVVGIFGGELEKVLNVDMLWRNERGELEWMSQIARRRGAIISTDTEPAPHLSKNPKGALTGFGEDFLMDFIDYSEEEEDRKTRVKQEERIFTPPVPHHKTPPPAPMRSPPSPIRISNRSPRALDVFQMFDRALHEKNYMLMVQLVTFAHAVAQNLDDPEWEDAEAYMRAAATEQKIKI